MEPWKHFQFCARCGQKSVTQAGQPFRCARCGFVFYFNPAIATAVVIRDDAGRALFIRRAKDPARGKLAMPGGFVDIGETAEEGLRREIREEVNLELANVAFLSSHPNHYLYQGVTYPVLDLFFVADARTTKGVAALDGVESFCWLDVATVDLDDIAFPSMKAALQVYRSSGHVAKPA